MFFASMPACRASRTTARGCSTSRGFHGLPTRTTTRLSPCNGRCVGLGASPADGTERLFGDGTFAFPSGRGRFVAVGTGRLANATGSDWPLLLNTGRVRDQWHTMTRTGASPRLAVHVAEPFVEMHPADAAVLGLQQAMLARVETVHGTAVLRVMLSERQQPGSVFAPIHWSGENSSAGRICALVQPDTDPFSGQPEAKATPARVTALPVGSHGFVLSRGVIDTGGFAYWARARMPAGHATFFALAAAPAELARLGPDAAAPRREPVLRGCALRAVPHRRAARGPARGRAVCRAGPGAAVHRMAEDLLRAAGHRAGPAPVAAGGASGRRCRRRTGRVRLLPGRAPARRGGDRRRRLLGRPRSDWPRAPAPTAAPACPRSRRCSGSVRRALPTAAE